MTLAVGGRHYRIGDASEGASELSFCPLQELDSDADRAFAAAFIETLLVLQGLKLTPDERTAGRSR